MWNPFGQQGAQMEMPDFDWVAPPAPKGNWLTAGLTSGAYDTAGLGGSALQALGVAQGLPTVENIGKGIADWGMQNAERTGREDLSTAPWREGGAPWLPYLGYQAAKNAPLMAAQMLAGRFVPRAAVPGALERAGTVVPKVLGGGGLEAGADFAARRAAVEAGKDWAADVTGAAIVGTPAGVGSMYQEAQQSGDAGPDAARRALAMGPVYGVLDAVGPAQLKGLARPLKAGETGVKDLAGHIVKSGIAGAAEEVPQEALQTAMEQSFRPDLSMGEKAQNIVDAALTGGLVGGVFGGGAGITSSVRSLRQADPAKTPTSVLDDVTKRELEPEEPSAPLQEPVQEPAPTTGVERPFSHQTDAALAQASLVASPEDQDAIGREIELRNRYSQHSDPELLMAAQNAAANGEDASEITSEMQSRLARNVEAAQAPAQRAPLSERVQAARKTKAQKTEAAPAQEEDWRSYLKDTAKGGTTTSLFKKNASPQEMEQHARDILANNPKGLDKVGVSTRNMLTAMGFTDEKGRTLETLNKLTKDGTKGSKTALDAREKLIQTRAKWEGLINGQSTPSVSEQVGNAPIQGQVQSPAAESQGQGQNADPAESGKQSAPVEGEVAVPVQGNAVGEDKLAWLKEAVATNSAIATQKAQNLKLTDKIAELHNKGMVAKQIANEINKGLPQDQQFSSDEVRYVRDSLGLEAHGPAGFAIGPEIPQELKTAPKAAPAPAAKRATITPEAEALLASIKDPKNPMVLITPRNRKIFQDNGVYSKDAKADEMVAKLFTLQKRAKLAKAFEGGVGAKVDPSGENLSDVSARFNLGEQGFDPQSQTFLADIEPHLDQQERTQLRQQHGAWSRAKSIAENIPIKFNGGRSVEFQSPEDEAKFVKARQIMAEQQAKMEAKAGEISSRLENARFIRSASTAKRTATDEDFAKTVMGLPDSIRKSIVFVDKAEDLPQQLKDIHARDHGQTDITKSPGALWNGKIHLVRDNIPSVDELEKTIAHEVMHGGANAKYRQHRDYVMSTLFDAAGGLKGALRLAQQVGANVNVEPYTRGLPKDLSMEDKSMLMDEIFAAAAEQLSTKDLQLKARVAKSAAKTFLDKAKLALAKAFDSIGLKRFAAALRKMTAQDFAQTMLEMRQAAESGGDMRSYEQAKAFFKLGGIQEMSSATRTAMQKAEKTISALIGGKLTNEGRMLKALMPVMSTTHILETWGKDFGAEATRLYIEGQENRGTMKARTAGLGNDALGAYDALSAEQQRRVDQQMKYTALNIDGEKEWGAHDWLKSLPNKDRLKELVEEANKNIRWLKQNKAYEVFDNMRKVNEIARYSTFATLIDHAINKDPRYQRLPIASKSSVDGFIDDAKLHDIVNARNYWEKALTERLDAIEAFHKELKENAKDADEDVKKDLADQLGPVKKLVSAARGSITSMERSPYFHLGRFGEHFVTFKLLKGENGQPDTEATELVANKVAELGFTDAVISRDQNNLQGFIRVDNEDQAESLFQLMAGLQEKGYLDQSYDIKRGTRQDNETYNRLTPQWVEQLIQKTHDSFVVPQNATDEDRAAIMEARNAAVSSQRQMFMDMLPDLSPQKVEVKRDYVVGYSGNMKRAFAFRSMIAANAIANMAGYNKIAQSMNEMRTAIASARTNKDDPKIFRMQQTYGEISKREDAPKVIKPDIFDSLRAWSHASYLGLSPSYVALNISGLWTLGMPQLGKHHSFMKSFGAMTHVTPEAFNILREAFKEGKAEGGWLRASDAVVTHGALERAVSDAGRRGFISNLVNRGIVDIGGPAREMGREADGRVDTKTDNLLRMATSTGYYSETFNRLVMALAAYDLYNAKGKEEMDRITGGKFASVEDYAAHVVNQSMLNYSSWNQPRMLSRNAPIFGKMAPLMFQFMSYQLQVMEKLGRETHAAFMDRAGTDEEKREARRFLMHHTAAMVAIAGVLGLPFVTAAAGMFDRLKDLFQGDDDEPSDIKAALRGWLADVFGEDIGEVLAHGAPRLTGVEVARRVGEQDLLPGSKLLADRRKWDDAVKEFALDAWGPAAGLVTNVIKGAGGVADGNILDGMKMLAPNVVKGPIDAIKLATEGYTDTQGRKLPITASTADIIRKALTFSSSDKAEYDEQRHTLAQHRDLVMRQATSIRSKLIDALESNDHETASQLMQRAQKFDAAHPGYELLPGIGSQLQRRAQSTAVAKQRHLPLETSVRDPNAAILTRWANYQ